MNAPYWVRAIYLFILTRVAGDAPMLWNLPILMPTRAKHEPPCLSLQASACYFDPANYAQTYIFFFFLCDELETIPLQSLQTFHAASLLLFQWHTTRTGIMWPTRWTFCSKREVRREIRLRERPQRTKTKCLAGNLHHAKKIRRNRFSI